MEETDIERFLRYIIKKSDDGLSVHIRNIVRNLMDTYSLSLSEVAADVCFIYIHRGHDKKFAAKKYSPSTFLKHYIHYTLHEVEKERKQHGMVGIFSSSTDMCDLNVRAVPTIMNQKTQELEEVDFDEFLEYFCDDAWRNNTSLIDIYNSFDTLDLAVMTGNLSKKEAAEALGISRQAYTKKLYAKKAEFNKKSLENGQS
jgi:hypothetical protein